MWLMALLENLERDGFKVRKKVFINPPDMTSFDPVKKRKMTISKAHPFFSSPGLARVLPDFLSLRFPLTLPDAFPKTAPSLLKSSC